MVQPLHIKNAYIWDRQRGIEQRDLYTTNIRTDRPAPQSHVIDLGGWTIFPGLINAHDHLELNHYPRSKFREIHHNAHQWGEDMNARLDTEPYRSLRAYPLDDRLFIGGLKNLLCGATTVIHHNPPHKALFRRAFPVRVVRRYGWAHSLHFNTEAEITESYHRTPRSWPWFIHLAEGTDDVASGEYRHLKALGCIGPNTVIVHGVGLSPEDIADAQAEAARHVGGRDTRFPLVWCPTTNRYLLGETGHPHTNRSMAVFLGSDSRLTADGDLLDELRFMAEQHDTQDGQHLALCAVTTPVLHSTSTAAIDTGIDPVCREDRGDFIAIANTDDPVTALCRSRRPDLALVVKDGVPQIGDPDLMARFQHAQTIRATLDGVEKSIHIDLVRRIVKCSLQEPGLEIDKPPTGKRFWFFNG